MGIYGALSTAVTGLRAQSHALENISGNIANSQTVGYKRIDTSFKDLIADAPVRAQIPGAVLAQSQSTNNQQGDIQTSSNETYIALNGNGFFVVEPKIGQADGSPLFAGTNNFTRRGDFEIDKDGLLVNGAGYYLKGFPIDTATGNISGSVPSVISISNAYLPANVTRLINYQANLPQVPKTANYNAASPNSELMKTWSYTGVSGSPAYPRTTNGATISDFATSVPARAVGAQTYVGTAAANTIANDGDLLAVTMHGATYKPAVRSDRYDAWRWRNPDR
ncbi:flagellar hook basal-body protein [Devosia sp. MC1541]|uniref:flagellar hook-basal body complex protein n=1 Tax=Devosia sp. MC1541 TaxID=2725264 RepID=UPI00145D6613|nr:flagellar hook basal-body protein [Devosia sp. MC1541]